MSRSIRRGSRSGAPIPKALIALGSRIDVKINAYGKPFLKQAVPQDPLYRAALAWIYPGRDIRCALLWTEGPRLMPISPERLAGRPP